jgi:hypothetical protein
MKKICIMLFIVAAVLDVAFADAAPLDGKAIIQKSDEAILAWRSGTRILTFTMKEGEKKTNEWTARIAIKRFPDGTRALIVMLKPDRIKGLAHLFWDRPDKTVAQWEYIPFTRRVRKLTGLNAYDDFLSTDFTYADFGIREPGGLYRLLGEETHSGAKAYKVETIPEEQCYYSRIISWIAVDTFLPIQRDYYDTTGRHWKTKLFEDVVTIDNVPKPLKVTMLDLQDNRSTEIVISEICYDVEALSKEAFNPAKLSEAVFSSVCTVNIPQKR